MIDLGEGKDPMQTTLMNRYRRLIRVPRWKFICQMGVFTQVRAACR
jgi:hypothetical protein